MAIPRLGDMEQYLPLIEGLCSIETGHGRAGVGKGNFYAEPTPQVELRGPNLFWHAGKILYEKYWLYRRF